MAQRISEIDVKLRRLDDFIESHEARGAALAADLKSKKISKVEYQDELAKSRRLAVDEILRTHQEDGILGSGYYENLVYTAIMQGLHIQNGTQRARLRLQEDIRKLQNIHGGDVASLPEGSIEDVIEKLHMISTFKTLFMGMGLGPEGDNVIEKLLEESFCKTKTSDEGHVLRHIFNNIQSSMAGMAKSSIDLNRKIDQSIKTSQKTTTKRKVK